MSRRHARTQVLYYLANYLREETTVPCDVHRASVVPIEAAERLNVYIEDETTGGSNDADEFEDTLDACTRTAPVVVEVLVKALGPYLRSEELAGEVEQAIATAIGDGDHYIDSALVSFQYAATGSETLDDAENTQRKVTLLFSCSYRTPIGDPFTLI